jgi:hypothetical protein
MILHDPEKGRTTTNTTTSTAWWLVVVVLQGSMVCINLKQTFIKIVIISLVNINLNEKE